MRIEHNWSSEKPDKLGNTITAFNDFSQLNGLLYSFVCLHVRNCMLSETMAANAGLAFAEVCRFILMSCISRASFALEQVTDFTGCL